MENILTGTLPALVIEDGKHKTLEVPVFSLEEVPRFYCSRYVRLAARYLFDKKFPESDAWEMRQKCRVITSASKNEDLISLAEKRVLKPGMIVGLFNPGTKYKSIDYPYTHVALYLGKNGKLLFADQNGSTTKVSGIEDFDFYHFQAREILDTYP